MNRKDIQKLIVGFLSLLCIVTSFVMCSSPEITDVDAKGKPVTRTDSSDLYYIYFTNGSVLEYKSKGTPHFSGNGNGNFYDEQSDFYYVMYVKNVKTGKFFR